MSSFNKLKKKYTVKISKNINVIHCDKKNMLIFVGPLQKKSLKLKVKVFLVPTLNTITVTNIPAFGTSVVDFKNAKKNSGNNCSKNKTNIN